MQSAVYDMLRNRIYMGEVVWNRRQSRKKVRSGKRGFAPRPKDERIVQRDDSAHRERQSLACRARAHRATHPRDGRSGEARPIEASRPSRSPKAARRSICCRLCSYAIPADLGSSSREPRAQAARAPCHSRVPEGPPQRDEGQAQSRRSGQAGDREAQEGAGAAGLAAGGRHRQRCPAG